MKSSYVVQNQQVWWESLIPKDHIVCHYKKTAKVVQDLLEAVYNCVVKKDFGHEGEDTNARKHYIAPII